MLRLALVLIIPSLYAADTTCPAGELSCKEGLLPSRSEMLITAGRNDSVKDGTYDAYGYCSKSTCRGTCCANKDRFNSVDCCPHQSANCCGNYRCCEWLKPCCGAGCCEYGYKCCGGAWCCKRNQRCGMSYKFCFDGAGSLSPTALVTLAAALLAVYAVKKL